MRSMIKSLIKKIREFCKMDLNSSLNNIRRNLSDKSEKVEKHLERHRYTYHLVGSILFSIFVIFLKLIEIILFVIVSIWNAITQSFLFNVVFAFLVIYILLHFLFGIAPHTGVISFDGNREDLAINTTADNISIMDSSPPEDILTHVNGDVFFLNCKILNNDNLNDYESIRLKGEFKYSLLQLQQLELNDNLYNLDREYDDRAFVFATTGNDSDYTIYDLKQSLHNHLNYETYKTASSDGLENYFFDTMWHVIESSSIYSRIMLEIRCFQVSKRDTKINYLFFDDKKMCSIDSKQIVCLAPGFKLSPLSDDCQIEEIEIVDSKAYYDNPRIIQTIPIRNDITIFDSSVYNSEYGCMLLINGSCDINNTDNSMLIRVEGANSIQTGCTGDFVFYYGNEPTELKLKNRKVELSSRSGQMDYTIGDIESNGGNTLKIDGEIDRGFISDIDLFPSFSTWYRNNVYLVPLTLISTIFAGVTLMRTKHKAQKKWNPFKEKKEEKQTSQLPTLIIKVEPQAPLNVSVETNVSSNKRNINKKRYCESELEEDYLDEHPECAD